MEFWQILTLPEISITETSLYQTLQQASISVSPKFYTAVQPIELQLPQEYSAEHGNLQYTIYNWSLRSDCKDSVSENKWIKWIHLMLVDVI